MTGISSSAKSYIDKTARGYQYKHDPYLNVHNLLKVHRDLVVNDDYVDSNRWMEHLENELMKFWLKPEVKEMKHGLYRSFFTNNGSPLPGLDDVAHWPKALQEAIKKDAEDKYTSEAGELLEGPDKNADKNFVRSHSRQTFAYGIAYHMTGNPDYFEMCREGAYALINLLDDRGSMFTKQELSTGKFIDDVEERTSQDLAYGMTGIAFYYYLTHDESVLDKVLLLKDYIFNNYYHEGKDIFTWLPKNISGEKQSVELVSHLDQLYAYMLWLMPSLPGEHKKKFKQDLKRIAYMMIEHFYSEVYGTFWGSSNSADMKTLGTAHTDFGHSVKSMWVIYQIGIWTKDINLSNFARQKIHSILEAAFDEGTGAWNRRINEDGFVDKDKEWWSLAELDQAAALLSLKDPSYLQYINKTYAFWFKNMVDYRNGEIWHVLDGETLYPKAIFPKAHCWKNALHSFEHLLFGYITSKHLLDEEVSLYYAFKSLDEVKYQTVSPYLFKANIVKAELAASNDCKELLSGSGTKLENIKVTFDSIH